MTEPTRIVAGLSLGEHRADALARATAHVASAWAEFDSARPEEHHASPELLAFATHGADAFRAAIYRNCEQAQMLWELANAHAALETLSNRPQLSVVPIRHVVDGCSDIDAHNTALCAAIQNDGRVFLSPATIDGGVWLRPCFTNFRTSDDDIRVLVDVVLELGADCATLHP